MDEECEVSGGIVGDNGVQVDGQEKLINLLYLCCIAFWMIRWIVLRTEVISTALMIGKDG